MPDPVTPAEPDFWKPMCRCDSWLVCPRPATEEDGLCDECRDRGCVPTLAGARVCLAAEEAERDYWRILAHPDGYPDA